MSYNNPVLPGFYPDPSIIRVDDTFYLINSSFHFFPGLPIHTSKDLINWELIGNAINRPSQLSLRNATTKVNSYKRKEVFTEGLYAPTIRFHDGLFYIVCTNLSGSATMLSNEDFQPQNFLLTCKDLRDPESYSNLIEFDFYGINPSLLFDDDGKAYLQGSYIFGYSKKPATVIRQLEIDVKNGKLLSEAQDIWAGSGHHVSEGPHIYKRHGIYWLLIAEGGTHRRHKVTMARSQHAWGPYMSYENNPVITGHEGSQVTCAGHAELVDDAQGNWWALMLARREFGQSYPLGRETYMVPIYWATSEYFRFKPIEMTHALSDRYMAMKEVDASDHAVTLKDLHTLYLREPDLDAYQQGEDGKSLMLHLKAEKLGSLGGSRRVRLNSTRLQRTRGVEISTFNWEINDIAKW